MSAESEMISITIADEVTRIIDAINDAANRIVAGLLTVTHASQYELDADKIFKQYYKTLKKMVGG